MVFKLGKRDINSECQFISNSHKFNELNLNRRPLIKWVRAVDDDNYICAQFVLLPISKSSIFELSQFELDAKGSTGAVNRGGLRQGRYGISSVGYKISCNDRQLFQICFKCCRRYQRCKKVSSSPLAVVAQIQFQGFVLCLESSLLNCQLLFFCG